MNTHVYPHRGGKLLAGWAAVAALGVVVNSGSGISMDIMLAIMSVVGLFGGNEVLPFAPDWAGMAVRVPTAVVMVMLTVGLVRYRRVSRYACGRCGRDDAPSGNYRRLALWSAGLSAIPAAGYAALKLHWAFGGTVGLAEPAKFADIQPWTPGFADTAVMAVIGIALAVAMATRWPRAPRWLLLTPALIGLALLVPVAIMGTMGQILGVLDGSDAGVLQGWVGWFVYGSFTAWGFGLTVVTVEYYYATRRTCRACGRG